MLELSRKKSIRENVREMGLALVLVGKGETEFGEKQNDYRIELRARYYF